MKTVAIIGTFDTKGEEFAYVASRFKELGVNTLTIHCGVFDPQTMPDVPNTEDIVYHLARNKKGGRAESPRSARTGAPDMGGVWAIGAHGLRAAGACSSGRAACDAWVARALVGVRVQGFVGCACKGSGRA